MQSHIKSLIIQLRDSGKSYQEISDILAKDYGISVSRQSIHGIYQRAIKKMTNEQANDELEAYDVLQYVSLGLSFHVISDITGTSIYKIKQIIGSYNNQLETIIREQQVKAFAHFNSENSLEEVMNKLNYKGQRPTKTMIKQLLSLYIDSKLLETKLSTLADILSKFSDAYTKELIHDKIDDKQQFRMISNQAKEKKLKREFEKEHNDENLHLH